MTAYATRPSTPRFDTTPYAGRQLSAPRRCRRCAAERQARSVKIAATIERVEVGYVFAKAAGIERIVTVGESVVLLIDPEAQKLPGRRPVALIQK